MLRALSLNFFLAFLLSSCQGSEHTSTLKVILGDEISPRPWLVSLLAGPDPKRLLDSDIPENSKSSGSLLCPNVVLTAVHSVDQKAVNVIGPKILVGEQAFSEKPAAIGRMIEKRIFHLDDGKWKDGIALIRLEQTPLGKSLHSKFQTMQFAKIADLSLWKDPAKINNMAILGYGPDFKNFDRPSVGMMLLHDFVPAKFSDPRDGTFEIMPNAKINLRMNFKQNITSVGSETIKHGKFQASEHGDSGGPVLINATSHYIYGIVLGGLDHEPFRKKLEEDYGKFDKHGLLINQDELDKRYFSFFEQFPASYAYNVSSSPIRERILETLKDWCPGGYSE